MAKQVRYIAKRSLIPESPTHQEGTQYTLTLTLTELDRRSSANRKDVESLGGDVYSTYRNVKQAWRCQHSPVTGSSVNHLREFLDSVIDGSTFEIDLDDGIGFRQVFLVDKNYAERRRVRRGDGGSGDYLVFAWSCREL